MAEYSTSTVISTVYEVSVPNPTNLEELNKAMVVAQNEWRRHYDGDRLADDTFTVRADEECIRIQWAGPTETIGGIE